MVVRTLTSGIHDAFSKASVQRRVRSFIDQESVWGSMPGSEMKHEKESDGKYEEDVSDDELLHYFKSGTRPFYSAKEIAERFDMDRSNAHRRLDRLHESGEIEKVEMSSQSVAWWHPRDTIVLSQNGCDEITAIDTSSGIASQGESRVDALKMIADAIELEQEAVEDHNEEASVPDTPWTEE